MKQVPAPLLTLVAGILITLVSLWMGQHHGLLPEQASIQAPLVDNFFNVMVTIGTALFIVVEGTIILFVIKYRRRLGDDTDGLPVEGNLPLEAFWTAIPAVIVIALGIYSVDVFQQMGGLSLTAGHHAPMAHEHATSVMVAQMPQETSGAIAGDVLPLMAEGTEPMPLKPPMDPQYGFGAAPQEVGQAADLVVNVTGIQYAWLFNYPDSGVMAGELHIPVNADVQLNLTGQDVIHSFWVPQFRLKQDAIPGMQSELRFVATRPGTYPIVCTELCGSYHGGMRSQVIVHPPEEFDRWLLENQVAQPINTDSVMAVNSSDLTEANYLIPYSQELGVTAHTLAPLHP